MNSNCQFGVMYIYMYMYISMSLHDIVYISLVKAMRFGMESCPSQPKSALSLSMYSKTQQVAHLLISGNTQTAK